LSDGHLLLEGHPGLAKTRIIKNFAKHLDCHISCIQLSPDLLPSDITGQDSHRAQAHEMVYFQPGPIFSNLILADDIDHATAKVQTVLLEAMEDRQVHVDGKVHSLSPLFMLIATQHNSQGQQPLAEAQLDRFLMKIEMEYPGSNDERSILRMAREEEKHPAEQQAVLPQEIIFEARKEIAEVLVKEPAERYMVDLINATRYPDKFSPELQRWIKHGISPRGTIGLDKCSRAVAWLDGRDYVTPEDTRFILHDVLRHRLILSSEAKQNNVSANTVIDELLKVVAVA